VHPVTPVGAPGGDDGRCSARGRCGAPAQGGRLPVRWSWVVGFRMLSDDWSTAWEDAATRWSSAPRSWTWSRLEGRSVRSPRPLGSAPSRSTPGAARTASTRRRPTPARWSGLGRGAARRRLVILGSATRLDAALGEQRFDVAVGQAEAQVPAHRQHDDVGREAETRERRPGDRCRAGRRVLMAAVCLLRALPTDVAVPADDEPDQPTLSTLLPLPAPPLRVGPWSFSRPREPSTP
jgi:hypothetical protein